MCKCVRNMLLYIKGTRDGKHKGAVEKKKHLALPNRALGNIDEALHFARYLTLLLHYCTPHLSSYHQRS